MGGKMEYLTKLFNLAGKVAALTGASGLLVGEMSRGLSKAGVKIALMDVNLEGAEKVRDEIIQTGGDAIVLKVDVTQKSDFENALDKILAHYGDVDILVNGAGANAPTPFFDISIDEWNSILSIQLTGTMLGCQVFGVYMVSKNKGSIINISSASAGPPLSKAFTYSVAKAGVKNLSQNIAREWATNGVRVNTIRPGFFPSEFMKQKFLTKERIDAILNHTPMKRFGEASELVGSVLWLSSDAASFVTGAEIAVDGGFTAMTI
jgi:NAD(P)-dependent dehydrogenase (short-subunit alcohol dehydrogenase family)